VEISANIQIAALLCQGAVFYFPEKTFITSGPHYFIVMNANPTKEDDLILLVASSQIEKVQRRRKNEPPETCVGINASEYRQFSKETMIDCNSYYRKGFTELVGLLEKRQLKIYCRLEDYLIKRLVEGIKKSRLIEQKIKDII
jgi:hypothetical protein